MADIEEQWNPPRGASRSLSPDRCPEQASAALQAISRQPALPLLLLLQQAILSRDDIKVIQDDSGGAWYFSEHFMTGAYARVLLLKAQGPLTMMAGVIREHSRACQRPVPLALFQCSPFNLSDVEIALCLKEMTGNLPYRDIAHLTTSIGNVFAYCKDRLEPGYAAMLAEWADVGQAENP
ncbi:MAG: hypothetical protein WAN11_28700 [Syntrophobacteraceae bacterium]